VSKVAKLLVVLSLLWAASIAAYAQNVQVTSLNTGGANVTLNRSSMKFNWIGALPASQVFGQVLPDSTEVYAVPASCGNSRAESTVMATASTTLTIYKCTSAGFTTCTSVGSIVFAPSSKVGTFTCSSAFALSGSSSQSLYVQGPATSDATLANISIALYATHN